MKIGFLITEDSKAISIIGPLEMIRTINGLHTEQEMRPFFDIKLLGIHHKHVHLDSNISFYCDHLIEEDIDLDIILVPAIYGRDMDKILDKLVPAQKWLVDQHRKGVKIAGMCTGTALIAAAGLLDGSSATSHWMAQNYLKEKYPKVAFMPDEIVIDKGSIITSGGAFSSLYLILYLVNKFLGKAYTIKLSKIFSIDMDRSSQSYFVDDHIYLRMTHQDIEIKESQELIIKNYNSPNLNLEFLANKIPTSKRNYIRRFKKATNTTPIKYIQQIKINFAKKALETSNKSLNEIMYDVGYQDSKSFRVLFKKITGLTPTDYRKKFKLNLAS